MVVDGEGKNDISEFGSIDVLCLWLFFVCCVEVVVLVIIAVVVCDDGGLAGNVQL